MISRISSGNAGINKLQISGNKKNSEIQKSKSKENNKLESIKKSIQDGSYKIDLGKSAEKIAKTLL